MTPVKQALRVKYRKGCHQKNARHIVKETKEQKTVAKEETVFTKQ
jgi:hypothetical protein